LLGKIKGLDLIEIDQRERFGRNPHTALNVLSN
jgi:hypothetical protein